MKWCNSQASASCFNSQVQTSCASFSMALLLLKMLALGWGARKNVQRKGLNTNQLIWLKSLMPESMRCLNDQAQWSDAKWSLHASVSHWSCSARLKHFLLQFDKKMLSNLKTLSKIKSKSHTHTHMQVSRFWPKLKSPACECEIHNGTQEPLAAKPGKTPNIIFKFSVLCESLITCPCQSLLKDARRTDAISGRIINYKKILLAWFCMMMMLMLN